MSSKKSMFPRHHRVFAGGRYLRAFDHLPDICSYEHSILTYLGSLMSFEKCFLDQAAFPSIATISVATKISETTVRAKMRALASKGYIRVESVHYLNERGKFQQDSNNYFFTDLAFRLFDDVMRSRLRIQECRKRAVGDWIETVSPEQIALEQSFSSVSAQAFSFSYDQQFPELAFDDLAFEISQPFPMPLSKPKEVDSLTPEAPAKPEPDLPIPPLTSESSRDIFTQTSEVARLVSAWENVTKFPVSKSEREEFFREYARIGGSEMHFARRICALGRDPLALSNAKGMAYLFTAPEPVAAPPPELKPPIPFPKSPPIDRTPLPKNSLELLGAITKILNDETDEVQISRLTSIRELIPKANFQLCLELFVKYRSKKP
ncbi:MAG: hypothetical protein H7249_11120 [Chitinophagaceae bacterium]|nr:hypothetical protein [Oligoflexus sp.]